MAFREVWRVMMDDGVCFLNIADSYHGSNRGAGRSASAAQLSKTPHCDGNPLRGQGRAKSLCLIPQRVAIALSDDGWIVRSVIIWEKPNCIPESIKDRCTSSYEVLIVLVKQRNYYWNWEEAREPAITAPHAIGAGPKGDAHISDGTHGERTMWWDWDMRHSNKKGASKTEKRLMPPIGNVKHQQLGKGSLIGNRAEYKWTRNMRDVWHIPTQPHTEDHPAMWPEALVERCIRIGSKVGDTVFDPFAGSGTTGLVARQLGRNSVLMDISEEYVNLMKQRLEGASQLTAEPPTSENLASGSGQTPFYRQGRTVEWYTPPEMLEAARKVMGSIDCDPCTSGSNHTSATTFYTAETDGLSKPWPGRVWMNPPFGKGMSKWMHKFNAELASGRATQAICLITARTHAGWFRTLCAKGASLCFPRPIKFINGLTGEQKDTAWMPNIIAYVGHRHEEFAQQFAQFGVVTPPLSKVERLRPVKRIAPVDHLVITDVFLPQIAQE